MMRGALPLLHLHLIAAANSAHYPDPSQSTSITLVVKNEIPRLSLDPSLDFEFYFPSICPLNGSAQDFQQAFTQLPV